MSILPPSKASRMLERPRLIPARRCPASKPAPSSFTASSKPRPGAAEKSLFGVLRCGVQRCAVPPVRCERGTAPRPAAVHRECPGCSPPVELDTARSARTRLSTLRSARGLRGWRDGGMEAIRKGMHVLAQSNQPFSHRPHGGASGRARIALRATGIDRQRGQALGHVVV
jgi:hypothetical protein